MDPSFAQHREDPGLQTGLAGVANEACHAAKEAGSLQGQRDERTAARETKEKKREKKEVLGEKKEKKAKKFHGSPNSSNSPCLIGSRGRIHVHTDLLLFPALILAWIALIRRALLLFFILLVLALLWLYLTRGEAWRHNRHKSSQGTWAVYFGASSSFHLSPADCAALVLGLAPVARATKGNEED